MNREESVGENVLQVIKGTGFALVFSLVSALLFALLLRFTYIPQTIIYPVNQLLKSIAIVVGTLVCVRGEKGFLKGGGIALAFTALSYLAFSAIGGDFSLSWMIAVELLLSVMTGVIAGSIAVNLRRNG
ncbi:MAG: TIGR04086 family membrane protein [Clostridia bacterium]|nr:TIGR04086 family membrane protein [Clostridia bacterium]